MGPSPRAPVPSCLGDRAGHRSGLLLLCLIQSDLHTAGSVVLEKCLSLHTIHLPQTLIFYLSSKKTETKRPCLIWSCCSPPPPLCCSLTDLSAIPSVHSALFHLSYLCMCLLCPALPCGCLLVFQSAEYCPASEKLSPMFS